MYTLLIAEALYARENAIRRIIIIADVLFIKMKKMRK